MKRVELFTLRVLPEERRMISDLARHLQRSQSDALRLLVRAAACNLKEREPAPAENITNGGGQRDDDR